MVRQIAYENELGAIARRLIPAAKLLQTFRRLLHSKRFVTKALNDKLVEFFGPGPFLFLRLKRK